MYRRENNNKIDLSHKLLETGRGDEVVRRHPAREPVEEVGTSIVAHELGPGHVPAPHTLMVPVDGHVYVWTGVRPR